MAISCCPGSTKWDLLSDNITCIRTRYADHSFEPIFMKFTWLMRIRPSVNLIVFGNYRPNRTTPKTSFLAFIQSVWGIFKEKICPSSHRKGYIYFCPPTAPFPQKWWCLPNIIFHGLFFFFFLKKLLNENIQRLSAHASTFLRFELCTTSATCTMYTIHTTFHPPCVGLPTRYPHYPLIPFSTKKVK